MFVQLKENRIYCGYDHNGDPSTKIFLPKRMYLIDKVIEGLGWLVFVTDLSKSISKTIIRFDEGIECGEIGLDEVYK